MTETRRLWLLGATTPEQVRAFLIPFAARLGLTGCYGDPERGFAGGYLP
jgi:hypothetical protein